MSTENECVAPRVERKIDSSTEGHVLALRSHVAEAAGASSIQSAAERRRACMGQDRSASPSAGESKTCLFLTRPFPPLARGIYFIMTACT